MWEAGREKGRGSGAPEVPATAVLGQHVAAAALKVQQAAVEGAVMRVSEGHAGSGPGQAAGTAAAGTQGGGLVLASAPHTVRPSRPGPTPSLPGRPSLPGSRGGSQAPELLLEEVRTPPRGHVRHCTTRANLVSYIPGAPGGPCHVPTHPTAPDSDTHGPTGERRAALALAAHGACHAGAVGAGVHVPALSGGHLPALVRARRGGG